MIDEWGVGLVCECASIELSGTNLMHNRARPVYSLLVALSLGCLGTSVTLVPLAFPVAAGEQNPAGFQTITVDELAIMLEAKDFTFVNVHVPYEGEIEHTDAFIPFDEIGTNLEVLPSDRAAQIILYCRSGRMSEIAAAELAGLGYTNVSHVAGGFVAWAETGRELLHSEGRE